MRWAVKGRRRKRGMAAVGRGWFALLLPSEEGGERFCFAYASKKSSKGERAIHSRALCLSLDNDFWLQGAPMALFPRGGRELFFSVFYPAAFKGLVFNTKQPGREGNTASFGQQQQQPTTTTMKRGNPRQNSPTIQNDTLPFLKKEIIR